MTWQLRLLMAGLVGLWAVIAVRLLYVQLWQHDDFANRTTRQQQYAEVIPARPGDILDRYGRLLATTITVRSLFVDPSRIESPQAVAGALATVLRLDAEELAAHIQAHANRRFLWIKRRLSEEETTHLLAAPLPEDVWGLREEHRRRYPHRHLAAHVLGWRNIDGAGQAGVERSLESRLAGTHGQRTLVRDAHGFVIDILEEVTQPPVGGEPLVLTLDLALQTFAEEQLDRLTDRWQARSACAVVLDPATGEVLTMASRPTFDPNAPADFPPETWINRAVAEAFEPGSTLKPMIAAWAVTTGALTRDERFDCGRGEYTMGHRRLHDAFPHGTLDTHGILVKSSNIGMAQIGQRLGNDGLFAALKRFGFGRPTGIELPAESAGLVRPRAAWDDYSTGSIPMGQEMAATPLQIIRAHAALANGGHLMTPHLVAHRTSAQMIPSQLVVTRAVDEDTANWIVSGPLVEVVNSGTARRAGIDGVRVFAKTGTAQKYDVESGAYAPDRYVSSCICGAPAEAPRVLVLVTVDEAETDTEPYGGLVAAPAAAMILEKALETVRADPPQIGGDPPIAW